MAGRMREDSDACSCKFIVVTHPLKRLPWLVVLGAIAAVLTGLAATPALATSKVKVFFARDARLQTVERPVAPAPVTGGTPPAAGSVGGGGAEWAAQSGALPVHAFDQDVFGIHHAQHRAALEGVDVVAGESVGIGAQISNEFAH